MTTANAVTGTSGHRLYYGLDTHGKGVHIDQTEAYSAINQPIQLKNKWQHLRLVNLINSANDKIYRLAKYLESKGYSLCENCYFNKQGQIYLIRIKNKEYRIKRDTIVELKE